MRKSIKGVRGKSLKTGFSLPLCAYLLQVEQLGHLYLIVTFAVPDFPYLFTALYVKLSVMVPVLEQGAG